MLDAGCWMLDAGCWMLDDGCWMPDYRPLMRGGGVRRPAFPIRILTSPEIFGGFESAGREGNQRRSRPNWIIQAVGTNPVNPVDPVSGFVHHPPATTPDLQTGLQ